MKLFGFFAALFRGDKDSSDTLHDHGREAVRPFFEGVKAEVREQMEMLSQTFGVRKLVQIEVDDEEDVIQVDPEPEAAAEEKPIVIPENWMKMRSLAAKKGVKIFKRTRKQIEAALRKKLLAERNSKK